MSKKRILLGFTIQLMIYQYGYGIVIHNEADDQDYIDYGNHFDSVGWLSGSADSLDNTHIYAGMVGSTVFIDEHWALTAAHCVNLNEWGYGYSYDMRVGTGGNYFTNSGNSCSVSQYFMYPGYSRPHTPDIALLYFEEAVAGITPATLFRGAIDRYNKPLVSFVGYGRPGTPETGWLEVDGQRRGCQSYLAVVFNGFDSWSEGFYSPTDAWTGYYLELGGRLSPGDSGGGWFIDVNGEQQLIGISSYISPYNAAYRGNSGSSYIPYFADWIDETMASVPEPTTLSSLLFGGMLIVRKRRNL